MKPSLPTPLSRTDANKMSIDFDLDAYCARVNYTSSRDVSLATLKALHFSYVHSVPFENLDQPISLEPSDLFTKIVTCKRGGYCYEVNSFFCHICPQNVC